MFGSSADMLLKLELAIKFGLAFFFFLQLKIHIIIKNMKYKNCISYHGILKHKYAMWN